MRLRIHPVHERKLIIVVEQIEGGVVEVASRDISVAFAAKHVVSQAEWIAEEVH